MGEIHWGAWNYVEVGGLAERCGHRRGRTRGYVFCELPVDHIVGRNKEPFFELAHVGRGITGNWYSWGLDLAKFTEDIRESRRLRKAKGLPPDPPWWPEEARNVH